MLREIEFNEAMSLMADGVAVYTDQKTHQTIERLRKAKFIVEAGEAEKNPPEENKAGNATERSAEEASEEVPEAKMPEAETPEKKKTRKKPEFDYGKLRSLRAAGWSVKKIADDMGVSDQTIYNHMAEIGVK